MLDYIVNISFWNFNAEILLIFIVKGDQSDTEYFVQWKHDNLTIIFLEKGEFIVQ